MTRMHRALIRVATLAGAWACGPALQSLPPAAPVPAATTIASAVDTSLPPIVVPATAPVQLPDTLASMLTSMAAVGEAFGVDAARFLEPNGVIPVTEEEPSWDLDVLSYATHEQVSRYVALFTGPARERIQAKLQRGKAWEPMIREKFRARGIPEDMYYLGLVESGYDPHAYSRAAAVGMWQFMSSTARGVGLRVDHWVDERRDPVRATDAAAKFLGMLHQQFGSYYLAAAAYNGGPGRVSRGLARFQDELQEVVGDDRFFALAEQSYLRSETRNYVPQLIAAALIGKSPARYGMVVADSVPRFAYDSVRVRPLTSLGLVAEAIGRPVAEVRDLNPHLLRGVTPPSGDDQLRLPPGTAAAFDTAWAVVTATASLAFDTVRAKKGQTLGTIAKARGVPLRRLAWYNPGVSSTRRLAVGKVILVPAAHVVAASRDVPDPSIERYGSATTSAGRVVHVVRRGESLGLIARRYRTTVAALQRANGLRRTVVYPGQSIIVRGTRAAPAARSAAARSTRNATSTASRKPATKAVPKKAVTKEAVTKKAIPGKPAPARRNSGR